MARARAAATTARIRIGIVTVRIGRRRVIGGTGLETDRSIGVQVTGHALDAWRNTALMLIHCGGTLSAGSGSSLRIEAL